MATPAPKSGGPTDPSAALGEAPTVPLPRLSGDAGAAGEVVMPEPDDLEGVAVGPYRLGKLLGRGGFGTVHFARHEALNRPTALKLLSPHFAADAGFVQRFVREARAAARLEHVGIVQVYDVGTAEGYHYIAMQYVDGISLERLIENRSRLPANEVISIAKRVASALEYAHANGIIHRDIKPGNILVSKDSKIKVADFGLARDIIETGSVSVTGQVLGTPHFMPPEQGRGEKVDERSDVYALGASMYAMLTGRVPFQGTNAISVIMKHATEAVVPPLELEKGTPRPLSDLVVAMMAKDPAGRPQKMGDVMRALEGMKDPRASAGSASAAAATAVSGVPAGPSAPPRASRPLRTIAGALLLLVVGVGVGAGLARKGRQPRIDLDAAVAFAQQHAGDPAAVAGKFREVLARHPGNVEVALKARSLLYQAVVAQAFRIPAAAPADAHARAALDAEATSIRGTLLENIAHHAQEPAAQEAWRALLATEEDVIQKRSELFLKRIVAEDFAAAKTFLNPKSEAAGAANPRNFFRKKLEREGVLFEDRLPPFVVRSVKPHGTWPEQVGQLDGAVMRAEVEFKLPRLRPVATGKPLDWVFTDGEWYVQSDR